MRKREKEGGGLQVLNRALTILDNSFVQTEGGNEIAQLFGMEKAFQELGPTAEGLVKVVSISALKQMRAEGCADEVRRSRVLQRRWVGRTSRGRARSRPSRFQALGANFF